MRKVLVTCAGSGVGQSVIDSLILTKKSLILGCDTNINVYAKKYCDSFFIAPSIYSPEYVGYLIELCLSNGVEIIVPGHDYELSLFSRNLKKFLRAKIKLVLSSNEIVEISRNKYNWFKFFSSFDCPVVPTYTLTEISSSPEISIFPAIVKPAAGSASQGISIVHNMKELSELNVSEEDIIQPYLFPKEIDPNYKNIQNAVNKNKFIQASEISIQLVFSRKSVLVGIFISENTLKNGIPVYVMPIETDSFEYISDIMKFVPILVDHKVVGPVNIQGRLTDSGLICFEMNMRFTGITGTRAKLGFNEVQYIVDDLFEDESYLGNSSLNKVGVRQVACTVVPRVRGSQAIHATKVLTILGGGSSIGSHFLNEVSKIKNSYSINLICRPSSLEKYREISSGLDVNIVTDDDKSLESIYCNTDILINFVGALANEASSSIFNAITYQFEQLDKIKKSNIPLVINISSQSVYDQTLNFVKDEEFPVTINSVYSFQKNLCEKFFKSIEDSSPSSKVVSLRVSRVIGPHYSSKKSTGFFNYVINSLINGKDVVLPNPENNTNLIDIRDLVSFIIFIAGVKNYNSLPSIINTGGDNLSVLEYCKIVADLLGIKDSKKLIKHQNNIDITQSSMLNCNSMESLGWSRTFTIQRTIIDMHKKILDHG